MAVVLLALGCAVVPTVFLAVPLLRQLHEQARAAALRELAGQAEFAAERASDALADLTTVAVGLAAEDDIQRATQSILFVETATAKFHRYLATNKLASGVVLYGSDLTSRAAEPLTGTAEPIPGSLAVRAKELLDPSASTGIHKVAVVEETIYVLIPVRGLYDAATGVLAVKIVGSDLLALAEQGKASATLAMSLSIDGQKVAGLPAPGAPEDLLAATAESPLDETRPDATKVSIDVSELRALRLAAVDDYTVRIARNVGAILLLSGLAGFLFAWVTREHRQERARLEAQLNALRTQMNPHFLFNALNSIGALVHSDPARAGAMTTGLADLYRSIVGASKSRTVPLADELKLVETYLTLEQVRFDERLTFSLAVDPAARSIAVPGLLLLTLAENAVKHGIAKLRSGGQVTLEIGKDEGTKFFRIRVTNPAPKDPGQATPGTNTGLANTRERLDLLYGTKHQFAAARDQGGNFVVSFCLSGESL